MSLPEPDPRTVPQGYVTNRYTQKPHVTNFQEAVTHLSAFVSVGVRKNNAAQAHLNLTVRIANTYHQTRISLVTLVTRDT
jgi:hypothetical protein